MSNKPKILTDERFEHAVNFFLSHEGGYNDDPDDDGGETKFGISKRSYPHVDVDALTVEQGKNIYKRDFWDTQLYKDIKDINLATKVFDLAVNMGSSWAHRLIQRALKSTGQNIAEDGVLGPITLTAINKADLTDLLAALNQKPPDIIEHSQPRNLEKLNFLRAG
jgi:lysozyme family protein